MVKVITMVRDEDDIVYEWVLYHGTLFGYSNIHVVDNMSTDNTWLKLKQMHRELGISIHRCTDYKRKGDCMTHIMRTHAKTELVFPLDIDEFIVLLDDPLHPTRIFCKNPDILQYLRTLPIRPVYKMPYLNAIITEPAGYECAPRQCKYAQYSNLGTHCKSFVFHPTFQGTFDHGNHLPDETHHNNLTHIALLHFHTRNYEQQRKKTYNNVAGFGYPVNSATQLSQLLAQRGNALQGYHHVQLQLSFLNGTYLFPATTEQEISQKMHNPQEPAFVSLEPFITKIDKCESLLTEWFATTHSANNTDTEQVTYDEPTQEQVQEQEQWQEHEEYAQPSMEPHSTTHAYTFHY